MDISVTIYIINPRFAVCILKVVLKGRVSPISYLSPSFFSMAKNGLIFAILFNTKFYNS